MIEKYFPGGICGRDKLGRPLFIAPVGCLDPKSFLKCITRTEFLQSRVYELERVMKIILPSASADAGRPIEQLSVIMDMHGLGLKHMSPSLLAIVSESVTVLESNYPEVLGTCFVINAPPLFSRLYACIKPLLSRETQEKVQVFIAGHLLSAANFSLQVVYRRKMIRLHSMMTLNKQSRIKHRQKY